MVKYVNGLMIQGSTHKCLGILKNRPPFQAGKVNGVGGKIEWSESYYEAMVREFREETGVQTKAEDWELIVTLNGQDFVVYYFRSFVEQFPPVKTVTDEHLTFFMLEELYAVPMLDNMRWMFPLAFSSGIVFPLHISWKE